MHGVEAPHKLSLLASCFQAHWYSDASHCFRLAIVLTLGLSLAAQGGLFLVQCSFFQSVVTQSHNIDQTARKEKEKEIISP